MFDRLGQAQPVGTFTSGAVEGNDVSPGSCHAACMAQGRGDVDALITLLPDTNHWDAHAPLDSGDIGESLGTHRHCSPGFDRSRHLGHRLGMTQRLARVSLAGDHKPSCHRGNDPVGESAHT